MPSPVQSPEAPSARRPVGVQGGVAAAAGNSPGPTRWRSGQLFGPHNEVEIEHGEAVYRLRITSLGKLILTK